MPAIVAEHSGCCFGYEAAEHETWQRAYDGAYEEAVATASDKKSAERIADEQGHAAVHEQRRHAADASRVELLQEYACSRGLSPRVDRETGVISRVKVLGLASRNGRTYDRAAVADAASLYEGVKVNVNHPKGPAAAPRDYQDRLGCLKNVRAEDGGLFADLHYNPRHALAEQLAWDAEFSPENVGLSHNVQARTKAREGGTLVEQILKVNSVDLVADPATTRGLFESAGAAAGSETHAERALREQLLQEMAQMRGQLDVLKQELQTVREARHVERLIESARPKSSGPIPEFAPRDVRQWARSVT